MTEKKREPRTFKVELKDRSHYIVGLPWESPVREASSPDTMLIFRYPEGDCDTRMKDARMMLGALYDELQVNDGLVDGDAFETEFGRFVCRGVHVVPDDDGDGKL